MFSERRSSGKLRKRRRTKKEMEEVRRLEAETKSLGKKRTKKRKAASTDEDEGGAEESEENMSAEEEEEKEEKEESVEEEVSVCGLLYNCLVSMCAVLNQIFCVLSTLKRPENFFFLNGHKDVYELTSCSTGTKEEASKG